MAKAFWHGDDDDHTAARFSAEHSLVPSLNDDMLEMAAGNEELLPEWPPIIRLPNLLSIPMPPGAPVLKASICLGCNSPLAMRENEWRHEKSFKERGGCIEPRPDNS